MNWYTSRSPEGWLIHDEPGKQYIAVDGRPTAFQDRAYISSELAKSIELFNRVAQMGWNLLNGNWTYLRIPELNSLTATTDADDILYREMMLGLGDGIQIVSLYNGVILNKQEVIDQLNIITGNSREESSETIRVRHDNRTLFRTYLRYVKGQIEGEPVEMKSHEGHLCMVSNWPLSLFNIDSIVRESAALTPSALETLGGYILGPIVGNRTAEQVSWSDWMLVNKRAIEYVAAFWNV